MNRISLYILVSVCLSLLTGTAHPGSLPGNLYDIRDFGASSMDEAMNTKPVQEAIDACTAGGGGVVLVAGGRYAIGTIRLKDNVTLRIESGAALVGSATAADYDTDTHKNIYANESHMDRCLIFAGNARNIGIEGRGAIDGQGFKEHFPTDGSPRPMLLRFLECKNLRLRDVTLANPAAWTSAWLYCEDIAISGVRIESRVNWNGDGLDFDGCRDVRVNGCSFDTSDDSICLQASRADRPCKDVTISDCIFVSKWAGIRIGMSSMGDFQNIAVSNCIFRNIDDAGLKIQMCEGGVMNNMVFSNLVMQNVPRPVFMTFNRFRLGVDTPLDTPPMRTMGFMQFNNISIDNSLLKGVPCGIVLSGIPGHSIEDVSFHNISFRLPGEQGTGGGTPGELPSFAEVRPEFSVLGDKIPFAGFFARHVRRLTLSEVRFDTVGEDRRPVIVCVDVDGLTARNLEFGRLFARPEKISLIDVSDARMTGN